MSIINFLILKWIYNIVDPHMGLGFLSYPNNSFLPGGSLSLSHLSARGWLL